MRTTTIALLLVCATGVTAAAEPMVVGIDGTQIYIDLGAQDGVGDGSTVELLHEVVARDPRTGATLRDRFALGALVVDKSGDHLSVAHAEPEVAGRVALGDRVRLASPVRKFSDPWAERVAASKQRDVPAPLATAPAPAQPGAPSVDHAALAQAAWQDTLGKPPEARIARWQQLLGADPKTPYRAAIVAEIQSLATQAKARAEAVARDRAARATHADRGARIAALASALAIEAEDRGAPLAAAPIARVAPGKDIALAFSIRDPAHLGKPVLFARGAGEAGFHRIELVASGDAYLTGVIAASLVRAPAVDWYVETTGRWHTGAADDDEASALLGSAEAPRHIAVEADLREPPIAAGRTHVDAHVDYVDFDGRLGKGFDQYYQAELDFGYRFLDPIHAVRLGFGTLSGTGGPKDVIDAAPTTCVDSAGVYRCKQVTFSYVYVELEHHVRENVAVMLRPQAGLLTTDTMPDAGASRCQGRDTTDCSFFTGLGLRARLRLGKEAGTNLVLGASFTQRVGTLFEAAYNWRPKPIVPVQLSVQVTDMPTPENFGVRLLGDVGLRAVSWFYPSIRLSYQARDLNHSGVSGGFALNFDW